MFRLIFLMFFSVMLLGCNHHSPTGRGQTLLFSEAEMLQMGKASFEQMKKQQAISNDIALTQYVNCVASRIISQIPGNKLNWEVVLFDSPQVNAFALPGGYIGVYTGLLKVAKTPDQLAAVIGHEVAHVLANHGNEQVSRAQIKGIGLKLANLALDLGDVSNKDLYMAALGLGADVGYSLPFGREQESEADVLGLEFMARAGFNPLASISLWQNMSKASANAPFELLSTHPSNKNRIKELEQRQAAVEPLYLANKGNHVKSCSIR